MPEGPVRFRPERPPASDRSVVGLGVLLLVAGGLLLTRPQWSPEPEEGLLVEVTGEVAQPGLHAVSEATLAAAVEAAGGRSEGVPETPLHAGDAVHVGIDGVRVVPAGDPLLVSLPVDVNHNGADALAAVPGMGPSVAEALVALRAERGPFTSLDELRDVPGIGAARLEELRPFLTLGDAVDRRLDLNTADAEALDRLPGVGPATAARILAERDAGGPFRDLDDVAERVSGIGSATVERWRGRARAEAP